MQKIPTPKPPPQREGALRESNAVTLREGVSRSFPVNKTLCHTEGIARSISRNISKDSANNARQKEIFRLSSI
ncbi:hypothetical protein [Helicobacter macacae]|uniref:hypothetical protein n=1 Tax=Helicobacter macacae TaxID=398626 RepID=UPI0011DD3171|nr:hypothetical protein [Helicobacter macacae]